MEPASSTIISSSESSEQAEKLCGGCSTRESPDSCVFGAHRNAPRSSPRWSSFLAHASSNRRPAAEEEAGAQPGAEGRSGPRRGCRARRPGRTAPGRSFATMHDIAPGQAITRSGQRKRRRVHMPSRWARWIVALSRASLGFTISARLRDPSEAADGEQPPTAPAMEQAVDSTTPAAAPAAAHLSAAAASIHGDTALGRSASRPGRSGAGMHCQNAGMSLRRQERDGAQQVAQIGWAECLRRW
jgi:hypothetical protein